MKTRLELHEILCDILGNRNCYFSPPSNITMVYPCIRYEEETPSVIHADDIRYLRKKCYSLMVLDENPDSEIPDMIFSDPRIIYISPGKPFCADGLYHWPFTIYV